MAWNTTRGITTYIPPDVPHGWGGDPCYMAQRIDVDGNGDWSYHGNAMGTAYGVGKYLERSITPTGKRFPGEFRIIRFDVAQMDPHANHVAIPPEHMEKFMREVRAAMHIETGEKIERLQSRISRVPHPDTY